MGERACSEHNHGEQCFTSQASNKEDTCKGNECDKVRPIGKAHAEEGEQSRSKARYKGAGKTHEKGWLHIARKESSCEGHRQNCKQGRNQEARQEDIEESNQEELALTHFQRLR